MVGGRIGLGGVVTKAERAMVVKLAEALQETRVALAHLARVVNATTRKPSDARSPVVDNIIRVLDSST